MKNLIKMFVFMSYLLYILQAASLAFIGVFSLYLNYDIMLFIIGLVGEEKALGARNVVRGDDGTILITNPGAMIAWLIPIWLFGFIQISSAFTIMVSLRKKVH